MPAVFEGRILLLEFQNDFLVNSEAFCFSEKITTWKVKKNSLQSPQSATTSKTLTLMQTLF